MVRLLSKRLMKLEKVGLPNGMELLSRSEKIILAADCEAGAVFKIDLANETHEIAIQVDEMKNPEKPFIPIAINGIAVHKEYLYWTNTSKALFCRIKIHKDGKAAGDVEVIGPGAHRR
jgi:sugar lactone lactonase YvrE